MKRPTTTFAVAILLAACPALAGEIRVPEATPSIQAAVDQAKAGDVISVGPGWWNEAIDLKGKPITLKSRAGARKTTIDGTGLHESVLRCLTGEDEKTIIDGFTIAHGTGHETLYGSSAAVGGGLVVLAAAPTIRNCIFVDNDVSYNGGAVYLARGGNARFESCTFVDNAAEKGGGVYSVQSKPFFSKCHFTTNDGRYSGGAMYNADGSVSRFEGCNFRRNRAGYYGGGVYEYAGMSMLENCTFDRNRATYKGGGIYNGYQGKSTIKDCDFLTIYDDVSGGDAPHATAIAPTGACLMDDGTCLHVSRQSCEDADGSYQGDRSSCQDAKSKRVARSSDLNSDGRVDDRDAMMLLLLWR